MVRCVIVAPTYNEAATIGDLLEAIDKIRAESTRTETAPESIDVLVVDDNSPDGTQDVISGHPGFGDWGQILFRGSKEGLGAAYRARFAAALHDGYDFVPQIDADGSHPAGVIPSLLALPHTNDVAIGSRYVPRGRTENWSARRRASSSGGRRQRPPRLARYGTRTSNHGCADTWRCERRGPTLAEVPTTFTERCAGTSKMSAGVAREAALLVLRWRVRERTRAVAAATSWTAARHESVGPA